MASKSVWITGAGSGVGAAAAQLFAQQGARLFLSDRQADRVAALRDKLAADASQIDISVGDLRDKEVAAAAGALIAEAGGRLDLLVNCVGYNVARRHWADLDLAEVDAVVQTNLLAPFYCAKVALRFMRAQRAGRLIHISSTDGLRVGTVGGPAYSSSKHGLVALSHSINLEESGAAISSCVICPGGIDTEFLQHRAEPPGAAMRAKLLQAQDVARVIGFVAAQPDHVRIEQIVMTPFPSSEGFSL